MWSIPLSWGSEWISLGPTWFWVRRHGGSKCLSIKLTWLLPCCVDIKLAFWLERCYGRAIVSDTGNWVSSRRFLFEGPLFDFLHAHRSEVGIFDLCRSIFILLFYLQGALGHQFYTLVLLVHVSSSQNFSDVNFGVCSTGWSFFYSSRRMTKPKCLLMCH